MNRTLVLFLMTVVGYALSLSCYQCKRENLPDPANPQFYEYDYLDPDGGPLNSSCLEETQLCEDEGDEYVNCTSITLGPDHTFVDGAESVDVFFCMYFDNHIEEDEVEMEICLHEGADVGFHCNVTANCGDDGCNYAAPLHAAPLPHACSTCELPVGDFCQGIDTIDIIQSDCDLVNCSSGINQCFTKFDQDSCNITHGCKTPDLADCQSSTCSVCEAEEAECTLDTTSFCEPGGGCIELPHVCLTCAYQACGDTDIPDFCDYQNCSTGVRECYSHLDSCTISRGCKPEDLSDCDEGSSTCSVCDSEQCAMDTTSFCDPGDVCNIEELPHECLTCAYKACGDTEIPEICDYQNCSTGVRECYSHLDSCTITRGCKPPNVTCADGSTTCSVCEEDEECHLDTDSLCKSGGECAKPIVCNSCVIDLATIDLCDSDFDWSKYANENCDKEVTCKNDVRQCAVITDGCKATVGCNEKQTKENEKQLIFVSFLELIERLTESYNYKEGAINDCFASSNTDGAIGQPCLVTDKLIDGTEKPGTTGSGTLISCSGFLIVLLNFTFCVIYFH